MEINKIIQHDVTKPFPLLDSCIDVVITSPPYWGLRDYGIKSIFGGDPDCKHIFTEYHSKLVHENRQNLDGGTIGNDKFRKELHGFGNAKAGFCSKCGAWQGQLGLEPHPQMYIDHLVEVFREVKRVLKKSGSFYLNLGDTYCANRSYQVKDTINKGCEQQPSQGMHIKFNGSWLQPKQLLGMPWRVAMALQEDGWILRNDIIWQKPNPMPSSVKDRLNNTFEHVFHFVESKKYYYDLDAIREPYKFNRWGGRYKTNENTVKIKPGDKRAGGQGSLNRMDYDCYPNSGKNPGDVFTITTKPFKGAHFAVFPEELLIKPLKASCPKEICKKCGKPRERIIEKGELVSSSPDIPMAIKPRAFAQNKKIKQNLPKDPYGSLPKRLTKTVGFSDCGCNAGFDAGVVLDPFCGRGTVGKVAKSLGLHYILFDAKSEYCELARRYIGGQKYKLHRDQSNLGAENKQIEAREI